MHCLHLDGEFGGDSHLSGTDENPETHILSVKQGQIGWLDILMVNENVVDTPIFQRGYLRFHRGKRFLRFLFEPIITQ